MFAGIGVPILLAYVYGVVPISLCRSGGCGVSTTNSRGVKLEFDDDNEVTVGVSGPYSGIYRLSDFNVVSFKYSKTCHLRSLFLTSHLPCKATL